MKPAKKPKARGSCSPIQTLGTDVLTSALLPDPIRQTTMGFGPFTFLGNAVLSKKRLIKVDEALPRRADSDGRLLRSAGRLCLVLTQKPDMI